MRISGPPRSCFLWDGNASRSPLHFRYRLLPPTRASGFRWGAFWLFYVTIARRRLRARRGIPLALEYFDERYTRSSFLDRGGPAVGTHGDFGRRRCLGRIGHQRRRDAHRGRVELPAKAGAAAERRTSPAAQSAGGAPAGPARDPRRLFPHLVDGERRVFSCWFGAMGLR